MNGGRARRDHALMNMPDEDLDFIAQFVLASGSLKEMAQLYGVSYPTIRATLDRVIRTLQGSLNGAPPDAMTELLAGMLERGEIKPSAAKAIRSIHREALDQKTHKTQLEVRE